MLRNLCALSGLFEMRAQEYLDSLPGSEQRGVNKFLKGLGKNSCSIVTYFITFSLSEWASVYFQGIRWNSSPRNDADSGCQSWKKQDVCRNDRMMKRRPWAVTCVCFGFGKEDSWSRPDTHFVKMGERSHCCTIAVVKGSLSLDQNCSSKKSLTVFY